MPKILIFLFLFSIQNSLSQEFFQILGLDCDNSELAKNSYAVMYDSESNSNGKIQNYFPLQSIGIYRKGDVVEIFSAKYLIIPTKKGFIYGTLSVEESKFDASDIDFDIPEGTYKLSSSITKPIFFKSKSEIQEFMNRQHPTFEDALRIDYEKISFINPNFYQTMGFESEVHGGATWFNATEKTNIYPIDWQGKISNKLTGYLDHKTKNDIVIQTLKKMKDYGFFEEKITPNTLLPWSNSINEHDEVFFEIDFSHEGVKVFPLTLLAGNSARSFLAKGNCIENPKIYNDLHLKKYKKGPYSEDTVSFLSPDKSTKVEIFKDKLIITDTKTGKILTQQKIKYNRIISSEFAGKKNAKKWKEQFDK